MDRPKNSVKLMHQQKILHDNNTDSLYHIQPSKETSKPLSKEVTDKMVRL